MKANSQQIFDENLELNFMNYFDILWEFFLDKFSETNEKIIEKFWKHLEQF